MLRVYLLTHWTSAACGCLKVQIKIKIPEEIPDSFNNYELMDDTDIDRQKLH